MNNKKVSNILKSFNSKILKGKIIPASDKSISHRSLIISALAIGESKIKNLLDSDDVYCTISALRILGVKIRKNLKNEWSVIGVGLGGFSQPEEIINCGNSGTLARILLGVVSNNDISVTFTGDKSLNRRPMDRVITPLKKMGAKFISSDQNKLPITIQGNSNLLPIQYENTVSSAQVKTSILLASLNVRGLTEVKEPYTSRDHTEKLLEQFGAKIKFKSTKKRNNIITLEGGNILQRADIYIPADLSSASFAMVAATIIPGSSVELSNVCLNYFRTGIIEVLKKMGAKIKINKKVIQGTNEEIGDIHVEYSDLNGIDVKSLYSPRMIDEYPILAVAAATASGKTILRGLTELKVKESNRFAAIVNGLRSCKVLVEDDGENIIITGTKNNVEGGAIINSNFDHRIAMSFLILGAVSNKPIKVMGCDSISTSYPNFLTQMNELGMDIRSDG